jgi:hypothetical protein
VRIVTGSVAALELVLSAVSIAFEMPAKNRHGGRQQIQHPAHDDHREVEQFVHEALECLRAVAHQVQRDAHNQAEADNLQHIGAGERVDGVRGDQVAQQVGEGRRLALQNLLRRLCALQHCADARVNQVHNHQPQRGCQHGGRGVVNQRDDAQPPQIPRVQPRRRRNQRGDHQRHNHHPQQANEQVRTQPDNAEQRRLRSARAIEQQAPDNPYQDACDNPA